MSEYIKTGVTGFSTLNATPQSNNMFGAKQFIDTQPQDTQPKQSFLDKTKDFMKTQADESKGGFGAANWAQAGIGAVGTIANIAIGASNAQLAKKKFEAEQAQRKIENDRHEAQMKRIENATNDAASTSSNLKSASNNMSANNPHAKPQPKQEAQETQELPMERQ